MNNSTEDKRQKFSEKLKDPRWQKIRLKVFERDEWACRICGDKKSPLMVHHKYYLQGKEPWDYPMDALVTLCENCHSQERENRPEAEYALLHTLKEKGFFTADLQGFVNGFQKMNLLDSRGVVSSVYKWALETPEIQRWLIDQFHILEKGREEEKNK
jgi:hypothetical protein